MPLTRRSTVEIERTPQLKMGWPNQALKQDLLQNNMAIVFGFVARATEQQFAVYNRYLGVLVLMAKNDMFFQFELNLVVDFSECFEMALRAYGDWDGEPNTFDGVVAELFEKLTDGGQLIAMVAEVRALADLVRSRNVTQPITLEHVGKAKIIFDAYIVYKAATYIRAEIESGNLKLEYGTETDKVKPPSADATLGMGIRRSPSF